MLEINKLNKTFRGVQALSDVSLKLGSGCVLAIVGDNGAGKSTLMKCISGATIPDSGSIIFNEKTLLTGNPSASRSAGIEMIYQDLSLCAQQDVLTNIFLGREHRNGIFVNRRRMATECKHILETLGLTLSLDSIVGNLSGGQQQSIAIARALISKPQLLVMDEPTAALAVKEVKTVLEQILSLKNQGVSVIMITHRLVDVFEVADRVIVMSHGKIQHDITTQATNLADLTLKIVTA
jgi:ABC-type sugar transport system ATPase subunit